MGHPADMSVQENGALGEHLRLCTLLRGPTHALGGSIDWMHARLAGRTVSTFTLVALLELGGWMVF